jgi:hypothetical protein
MRVSFYKMDYMSSMKTEGHNSDVRFGYSRRPDSSR